MHSTHDYLRLAGVNLRNFVIVAVDESDGQGRYNTTQVADKVGYEAQEIIAVIAEKARDLGYQPIVVCEIAGDYTAEELSDLADSALLDQTEMNVYVVDEALFREVLSSAEQDELAALPQNGRLC